MDFFFPSSCLMNRRLNWANGATALNMRSLQPSVANWHPAFSPLCSGTFVQSPFIKPAQGRGEFSGLSPSLVLGRQLRQGLVQLLRSALCLEFREEQETEKTGILVFFRERTGALRRRNKSEFVLHTRVQKKKVTLLLPKKKKKSGMFHYRGIRTC